MKDTFIKFKQVIGGTEEEALEKFPWLKDAEFSDAVVDISNNYLVWKDGTWEGGVWEGGVWEYGVWKDGIWKDGRMWSNSKQLYENVEFRDGYFIVI